MRVVQGVFWWIVTLAFLFIVDDLVFGPFFWSIALVDQIFATAVAFFASVALQLWLVHAGMQPHPGSMKMFLLKRLMPDRTNKEVAVREESLGKRAMSKAGAVLITPLVGGVIPSLLLYRRGVMSEMEVKRFSILLSLIYASVFALVHGGFGIGAVVRSFF